MTNPNPHFINFGGVLIPEHDRQAHFAFTGTTGSGKTLLMRLLQQSPRCHIGAGPGHRAIVYDAKQDAMALPAAYCDCSQLFTLYPFDDRGAPWNTAAGVIEPRVALEITLTLIPETSESQPYFANAARHLTYGVMFSLKRGRQISKRTTRGSQRGSDRPSTRRTEKKSLPTPSTRQMSPLMRSKGCRRGARRGHHLGHQ